MEPVEVRLARIEEHMVHVKGDLKEIKTALVPVRKEIEAVKIQQAVDHALYKRDRKWIHGISAVIAAVCGWLGHLFHT